MRERVTVLVEGARIAAVREGWTDPAGASVIDLRGYTVLPGLIDAHTHLLFRPGRPVPEQALRESASLRALYGLEHARLLLESGFTAIRDLGTEGAGFADVAVREAIERGLFRGPRVLAATLGVTMTGGDDDRRGYSPELDLPDLSVPVDGADAMRKEVRRQIKYGADLIKVYATAGRAGGSPAAGLTVDELRAAVEEARKQGRRVAAHASGGPGARNAVLAGVASIEHGDHLEEETLRLMAEKGVYWVPTPLILDEIIGGDEGWPPAAVEDARRTRKAFSETFRRGLRVGVEVALGTEAGGYFQRTNARQLEIFVKEGMPPMQAIQSATSTAAALLGIEDETGTVEEGKRADLVSVRGDPLEDIRELQRVAFVMKGGMVVVEASQPAGEGSK